MNFGMYDRFAKHVDKTFNEASARYLKEFQGKDALRIGNAIRSVLPYIGNMRLIDIDDEAMQQYKHDRLNGVGHFSKPAMVGTIGKELTQTVTILNRACRIWRWIPSAPKLVHVEGPRRKPYPLTWDEQDRLFRCLPTGWDVGAAGFAINTGVRREELFGLKWTDKVDVPELGEKVFVFVLNATKNGHSRAVICNSLARRAVQIQWKWQQKHCKSEYVFPSRASNRMGSRVRGAGRVFQEAWKNAGLPCDKLTKAGIHNLRHTFGYRLRAVGVPEEDRNSLLGHNNHNLAQHYAMPDLVRLLEHAEKITERRDTVVIRSSHDWGAWDH